MTNANESTFNSIKSLRCSCVSTSMSVSSCHPQALLAAHTSVVKGAAATSQVCYTRGCNHRALVFFEGDQILDDNTKDLLGRECWSPESHFATLQSHVDLGTSVLLVMPDSLAANGQACYDNFLTSMTATGEPLGFQPRGYRAASHLSDILTACGCQPRPDTEAVVKTEAQPETEAGPDSTTELKPEFDPGTEPEAMGRLSGPDAAKLTLVGFSKGAVVVNQLLVEMAWREEALMDPPSQPLPRPAAAGTPAEATAEAGVWRAALHVAPHRPPTTAPAEPPPDCGAAVLDRIDAVHFLDAGLNCRGVHLTDTAVVAGLGRRQRRRPLVIHLHGTPRQWGDRRRPWIVQERDRFMALLRAAGVPTQMHHYFDGQTPSLRQHFEVIRHANIC